MYEFYPYFTNDGTVGLYSQRDDDIYHSTYGAVSESWQKFIFPSHLSDFIKENNEVKILDICYGIGYNTKTALQVFVDNFLKNSKKNIIKNSNSKSTPHTNIAAIDSDNILQNDIEDFAENIHEINKENPTSIEAIDTDNESSKKNENNSQSINKDENSCASILIDAIDIDKNLIGISPFIRIRPKMFFRKNNQSNISSANDKLNQINKMQSFKFTPLKKGLKLKKEVSIILLLKLLEINFDFNDKILQTILDRKKFSQYLSKYMLNFADFFQNRGSYDNRNSKITAFLHNIYYQYLSRSYKNAKNILNSCKIDINLFDNDARDFVKTNASSYDFIFLDAFTPSKCPTLWTLDFFAKLHEKLNNNGMVLTYSNSAAIRNAFLNAGFKVGKIYDEKSEKFVGTIAVKNSALIEHPLDEHDLGLINSRAGICFRDENLDLDNSTIIANRQIEMENSNLISSSQFLKGNQP